jgi:hypothetical protein
MTYAIALVIVVGNVRPHVIDQNAANHCPVKKMSVTAKRCDTYQQEKSHGNLFKTKALIEKTMFVFFTMDLS